MGDFLVYILKSSLSLAAFYLFYKVMLSKETFHRFNRVVLLLISLLSVVIPLIKLPGNEALLNNSISLNLEQLIQLAGFSNDTVIAAGTDETSKTIWPVFIVIIYLTGVLITMSISAISIIRMAQLIRRTEYGARIKTPDGIIIVLHKEKIAPFSWMKYIVISENDYNENGREIVMHENAHIKRRHSADMILCEIVKVVHWFNPAAWLFKQEIKNIHEYQADDAVIKNGIDAATYQLLLIKKAVGDRLYSIANSFNHSKLKNRITMITKKRSTLWSALRVLYVLPLSLFAVAAFASEEITTVMAPVSEVKIKDFIQADTIKVKKSTSVNDSKQVSLYSKQASGNTIIIKKTDSEKVELDTIIIRRSVNDSTRAVIKTKINTIIYTSDSVKNNRVATFSSKNGDSLNVLVFVDGVEKDTMFIKQIDSKDIKEVKVFRGAKATAEFGEKAKNGVVVITTKGDSKDSKGEIIKNVAVRVSDRSDNPIYVIDGVVQESSSSKDIDPKSISSIKVLKGEAAIKEYGEKGKNGVIIVNLKK
ncbi:MAG: TonB-dependent receptor [Bacteroidetes bacterium HGW-Bacteroidetes-7]|jgi:beta-lactamase regulating signal transducer with metallopeptidase domain|nr:MAG: TonB-dependent receptor [Bacteroidetes bacterium HGW-Bacteroidetes-7]